MVRSLRGITLMLVLAGVVTALGCSTVASTLGFAPPTHKLTPNAKRLKEAHPYPEALPRELNKALLNTHVLEPGDSISVEATEMEVPVPLPVGDLRILPEGVIELGRYGRLVAAGKTVPQIEAEIRKLIEAESREKDKAKAIVVSVRLVGHESKVYYVLGEVGAPGMFPIIGRETVLDGILTAGGITRQASTHNIILSRPTPPDNCRVVLPVCYDDIVQIGDTSTNYQLQPGDRIYVPSKSLFEDALASKKGCGPCRRPQFPCVLGNCNEPPVPTNLPGIPVAPIVPQPAQ